MSPLTFSARGKRPFALHPALVRHSIQLHLNILDWQIKLRGSHYYAASSTSIQAYHIILDIPINTPVSLAPIEPE